MLKLVIYDPKTKVSREERIQELPKLLGRSLKNDIIIPDDSISGRHAVIEQTPSGIVITDLNSTNGILVNGTRHTELPLRDGLKFRLGDVEISVFMEADSLAGTRVLEIQKGRKELTLPLSALVANRFTVADTPVQKKNPSVRIETRPTVTQKRSFPGALFATFCLIGLLFGFLAYFRNAQFVKILSSRIPASFSQRVAHPLRK